MVGFTWFVVILGINSDRDNFNIMRLAGVNIPDNKRIEIALTALFGVGRARAHEILDNASIEHGKRAKELTAKDEAAIRDALAVHTIEGDLKRTVSGNIKRLKDIQSYRGTRHAKGLPSRGQRTKTNGRTLRGKKKTMGSGRRKVDKK